MNKKTVTSPTSFLTYHKQKSTKPKPAQKKPKKKSAKFSSDEKAQDLL